MNELALFGGSGGGILGGKLLGWRTVCAVEIDPFCREVLLRRQLDRCLPRFPIWDDVRTFDGTSWRGFVDIITGGFPCQDISCAGTRTGLAGARSSLVFEMLRIVDEVRPAFVFAENSPNLRANGLGEIVEAFSGMGYVGRVGVLGARHVGANHRRDRMWILAYDKSQQVGVTGQPWVDEGVGGISAQLSRERCGQRRSRGFAPSGSRQLQFAFQATDSDSKFIWEQSGRFDGKKKSKETSESRINSWWPVDIIQGMDDGLAYRLDRVRATGNGQVPAVARLAWNILSKNLSDDSFCSNREL